MNCQSFCIKSEMQLLNCPFVLQKNNFLLIISVIHAFPMLFKCIKYVTRACLVPGSVQLDCEDMNTKVIITDI